MERFRGAPELRSVLEETGIRSVPGQGDGADLERRRLVGPGGFLWAAQDLRIAGKTRQEEPELSRCRPVEPRTLGLRRGQFPRYHSVLQPHRPILPRAN